MALDRVTLDQVRAQWASLSQQLLKAGAPLLAAALGDSTPTALTGDQLTLATPPARLALLADPEQQRVIAGATTAIFGVRLRLTVTLKAGSGPSDTGVIDARQKRYLAAQEHPIVRELMQRFEADLVGRELVDFATWLKRLADEQAGEAKRRFAGDVRQQDTLDG